jgi:type VI secretion system secreted protein Hcp
MKQKNNVGRLFTCLLLLVGGVLTIAPTPCNLTIAEYPGSSEKPSRQGTSDVFAVDHELVQPFDAATGLANGVRQHRPLTVLKVIDKATPGFHKALATGQNLQQAVLDFYRIDPATREEVKYYMITLTNVRIVGMKTMMPTSFLPENESYRHMEEVRLVYERIEWNWIPDSVVEMDQWHALPGAAQAVQSTSDSKTQPTVAGAVVKPSNSTPTVTPPTDPSGAKQNAKPATTKK